MHNRIKQTSGKLTKKIFLTLPAGKYLVSNTCIDTKGTPLFAEYIADLEDREKQWRRIVASKSNGRKFMLFDTVAAHAQFLEQFGFGTNN
jgi:hypothetical protein